MTGAGVWLEGVLTHMMPVWQVIVIVGTWHLSKYVSAKGG